MRVIVFSQEGNLLCNHSFQRFKISQFAGKTSECESRSCRTGSGSAQVKRKHHGNAVSKRQKLVARAHVINDRKPEKPVSVVQTHEINMGVMNVIRVICVCS